MVVVGFDRDEVASEIVTYLGHTGSEHVVDSVRDNTTTVFRNEHQMHIELVNDMSTSTEVMIDHTTPN